jgi:hypothetical protein
MTLGAYFAAAGEHQQLAWMGGSTLEVLVDSAVSNGQVLIMQTSTARGSGVPVHVACYAEAADRSALDGELGRSSQH